MPVRASPRRIPLQEDTRLILITGANGNLGRRLAAALLPTQAVRAVVRSRRAADQLEGLGAAGELDVRIVDYLDAGAMAAAARGCTAVVHLVGIIKESSTSRFEDAHEGTSRIVPKAGVVVTDNQHTPSGARWPRYHRLRCLISVARRSSDR